MLDRAGQPTGSTCVSRNSRSRFRPTWMGRFNAMRDEYAAARARTPELLRVEIGNAVGNTHVHRYDQWYEEIQRTGGEGFAYRECPEPHATTPLPLRDNFEDAAAYAAAMKHWIDLGEQAATCFLCTVNARRNEAA
jgi:hypothetical protein